MVEGDESRTPGSESCIVVLDATLRKSTLLEGDPDEPRFAPGAPLEGRALETLLNEGWRVSSISTNRRVIVLEHD